MYQREGVVTAAVNEQSCAPKWFRDITFFILLFPVEPFHIQHLLQIFPETTITICCLRLLITFISGIKITGKNQFAHRCTLNMECYGCVSK